MARRLFSIDLRSLAVFRMALGGLLLSDLWVRSQDLAAHYTDWGVLPRDVLAAHFTRPLSLFSLHLVSGSAFWQATLFIIAGVVACGLVVGFRTPMATCASWLLLISLQARNPRVLHGSDELLCVLLFWSLFVPLGARWSLDSLIRRAGDEGAHIERLPTSVCSVGAAGLLLQVCTVYWCTAGLKSWDVWWGEASAVYRTLNIDQIVTPFGRQVLGLPALTALLSRAVIVLEFLGPCLAFVPFFTPQRRLAVIGTFFGFHLGIAACTDIGLFPYVSMVSWLVFVPGRVWGHGRPGPAVRTSRPAQVAAAFFVVYIALWNLRGLEATSAVRRIFPWWASPVGYVLRIDQHWNMFSPWPLMDDGWFVMPGRLADGRVVDVWTAGPVGWEKPAELRVWYPHDRWWKFMENMYPGQKNRKAALGAFAGWVCRVWDARGQPLARFQIFFMQETTLPDYQTTRPEKKLLWTHSCAEQAGRSEVLPQQ